MTEITNKLYNENCIEFLQQLPDNHIDLTITSPPYNLSIDYGNTNDQLEYETYLNWTYDWLNALYKKTVSTGRLCLNIPLDKNKGGMCPVYADITKIAQRAGWKYKSSIVWNEQNISRRTAWGSWKSASAPHVIAPVEMIIVLYKDNWKRNKKGTSTIGRDEFIQWTNGVWTFNGEKKRNVGGHPAAFPEELPKRCIQLFSYKEDLIFDPFMGSGTTAVIAKKLGRKWLGCETNADYHQYALNRVSNTESKL